MKVLIQRYGILIKSIDITGDRARIGNAADSEVMIDDPYLSANVAELVRRGGDWHIVDTGTSLEGVTREGNRIEEEALIAGVPYQVGGFELVMEGTEGLRKTGERPAPAAAPIMRTMMEEETPNLIPRTMMEADAPMIPKTMFEAPMPREQVAAPRPVVSPAAAPIYAPAPAAVQVAPKRRSLVPLILGLAGALVLLVILGVVFGGKKKPQPAPQVATTTATTSTAPVVAPPVTRPATGDEQSARLQIDEALNSWEAQLKQGADPALRDRFCMVASEVAAVHAASGNPAKAKEYYKRIVAVGAPETEVVKLAQAKL
jgi:hypothetical protein